MDSGFHHDQTLSYAPNRHAISFQTSAVDSTNEMIMMGDYYYRMNGTAGMMFSGNSGMGNTGSGYAQYGSSCGSVISDSVPGLKHDAGLAVEWSVEEQYKLEEGITKYADVPSISRYIKIAATLRDKTVRDVALRCRWMTSKRRKHDELNFRKKLKDKKDKLVESLSKPNISSVSTLNVAPFSVSINNRFQNGGIPFEGSYAKSQNKIYHQVPLLYSSCRALSISTRHLLQQNNQIFGQISANISALKLQENVDLFNHAKNNITAILNDMKYMPGPPLPVSLNVDIANTILPHTSQKMTFGSSSRTHLKQEPDY